MFSGYTKAWPVAFTWDTLMSPWKGQEKSEKTMKNV
jgi:hypothetical protein